MNEINILKEALNIASERGCFNLDQASKINHCLEVVAMNFNEYQKIKNTNVEATKPGPTLNKKLKHK